jgi:hypothetical protein
MAGTTTQRPPDDSKVSRLLGVTMTLLCVSFFFLSLRVYSRTRLAIKLDWDDYIICLAMVGLDIMRRLTLTLY